MPLEVNLSTEQRVLLTIQPQTPAGNPAPVDGDPVWEVTSGACTLEPPDPPNPMQTWVNGITGGDSVITVTADADLGAGFVPISDTCLAPVADPQAASLGMTAGEPELKPAA